MSESKSNCMIARDQKGTILNFDETGDCALIHRKFDKFIKAN